MPPLRQSTSVGVKESAPPASPTPPVTLPIGTPTQYESEDCPPGHQMIPAQRQLRHIEQISDSAGEGLERQHEVLSNIPDLIPLQEVNDIKRGDIANLLDLFDDSRKIFELFGNFDDNTTEACCDNLWLLCSNEHRRLKIRRKHLLVSCEPYGEHEFITPTYVIVQQAMQYTLEYPKFCSWRPDPIIYFANLALQASMVFTSSSQDRLEYLRFMSQRFPMPFACVDHVQLQSATLRATVELCLDILTHLFIETVANKLSDSTVVSDGLLHEIFFNEETEDRIWAFTHIDIRERRDRRLDLIRGLSISFPTPSSGDIEGLREQFPWSKFAVQVVKWSLGRKDELFGKLLKAGRIDIIRQQIITGKLSDIMDAVVTVGNGPHTGAGEIGGNSEATWQGMKRPTPSTALLGRLSEAGLPG
ncbi:hypothetical protein LTR47_011823, partial [Exophiala xenobiotica]